MSVIYFCPEFICCPYSWRLRSGQNVSFSEPHSTGVHAYASPLMIEVSVIAGCPQGESWLYKNPVIWELTGLNLALSTPKYKKLFSLEKKNTFLYKKITQILIVKILVFNCVRNFWQKVIVYMFSLIYVCLDFLKKSFSINHFVSVAQFFCQWLHYDNLWKITTY